MAAEAEILAWAQGAGAEPACVRLYASEHNGNLPPDVAAFCDWGNQSGVRAPDGTWTCPTAAASGQPSGFDDAAVIRWVKANPITATVIGIAAFGLVFGFPGRRRRRRW